MDNTIVTLAIEIKDSDMLSSGECLDRIAKESTKELMKEFGNDYNTWYNVRTLDIKKETSCIFIGMIVYIRLEVSLREEMMKIMKEVEERLEVGL